MFRLVTRVSKVTTAATGVFVLVNGYRLFDFNNELKSLSYRHLKGRSLADRINITYLYLTDRNRELTHKLAKEHNMCFNKFKDGNIWNTWYNTPLVCYCLAEDYHWLSSPVYQCGDGAREHCIGYSCNLNHRDDNRHPSLKSGNIVFEYLREFGIDYDDYWDYDKLVPVLTHITPLLNDENTSNKEELTLVKTYIEQVKELNQMRKNDWQSNTLITDMEKNHPLFHFMIKYFYGVK